MTSFQNVLVAGALVASLTSPAQAAVVQYAYQGEPLFCGGDPASTACGRPVPQPGFFGQVTIDTAIFGASGPASFAIDANRLDTGEVYFFSARSFDGTRIDGAGLADIGDIPFFVSFSGSIGLFLQPGAEGENSLALSFNARGEVVGFSGSDTDGGSTDSYISSTEGDSTGGFGSTGVCEERNVCTFEPGTWTRTVLVADPTPAPSPVPLPAGMLLLGGALAALGASRRCRNR